MFAETVAVTPGSTITLLTPRLTPLRLKLFVWNSTEPRPEPLGCHRKGLVFVVPVKTSGVVVKDGRGTAGVIRVIAQQVGGSRRRPHNGRK